MERVFGHLQYSSKELEERCKLRKLSKSLKERAAEYKKVLLTTQTPH